jgi:hypothetical protein
MTPERKLQILAEIHERAPHTRLNSAMWQLRRKEKAEELRRPVNKQRGVVAMIRKLVHREGA